MSPDDWGIDEPPNDLGDRDAAAREQRLREREARRLQRTEDRPASPEHPGATASGGVVEEQSGAVPPPEQRLPSAPAREPFAQRVSAMGRRLGGSRAQRDPAQEAAAEGGSGGTPRLALRGWPLVALAVAAALLLWFLIALFQPFHGSAGAPVAVTISKGAGAGEVGDLLDETGVVSSGTMFEIRVSLAGKRSELLPGTYTLRKDQSYGDAIEDVTTPAQERTTATVTIPEGLSRSQVAPLVKQSGLSGGYAKASVRSRFLDPNRYGAQGKARNLEGFLFPDTYQVKADSPASDLVQLQVQDFRRRIKGIDMSYARSVNLTVYDVLTIASMIEREVQVPSERRLVAAVIYNRLRDGMPLGIDATTRFAVGNYTTPLTNSQLDSSSPYNTRLVAGLPPGPIGSPGLASIDAAAHPAKVDFIFYVVRPGTCGEHNFSSNETHFVRDQAAYQQALEAEGGSPDTC